MCAWASGHQPPSAKTNDAPPTYHFVRQTAETLASISAVQIVPYDNLITNLTKIFVVSVTTFASPLFAQSINLDQRAATVATAEPPCGDAQSVGKLKEEDRQAYAEALDYIRSIVSSQKALSSEEKDKIVELLCAKRSAREIIVIGNLLRVLVLDKAADTQFAQRMAKEDPRYRASLATEAAERTAWALDAVRRYLEKPKVNSTHDPK